MLHAGAASAAGPINEVALHRHIAALAADEMEGRWPGSRGEALTLDYLRTGFSAAGAEPGNGDSFLQSVPLVSWTLDPAPAITVRGGEFAAELVYREEMVAVTRRLVDEVFVKDSPVVFAGYGVVAPEYGWNDYEGLDACGKTVVVLVNDPGFASGDPELFNGRAMTYYGRWTYKYEEAARQGAEAVLIVHETEPASYGWAVIGRGKGEHFGMETPDGNRSRAAVEGWISAEAAEQLFAAAGEDFATLKAEALKPGFTARLLGDLKADMQVRNTIHRIASNNVVARVPGAERPDEYVIFTAHWDHLGREGDEIYNGAVDNASGTAALLLLAEAYAQQEPPPARSVMFVAVTAEEQGLLGSAYYAANPLVPLAQTVAVINVDGLNYIGPTRDISVVGYGASELDAFVDSAAAAHGRNVVPDQRPEAGVYYRSDHFNFAKQGVPALYPKMGMDLVDGGAERGRALAKIYNTERYHKTTDEYSPDQDWSGGVEDLALYFDIGLRIANSDEWPNWVEGNEFRAVRDAQRPAAQPAPATGGVRFADWSGEGLAALVEEAAAADRFVMVVITQPDWCPGCIQLDQELLRNPSADDFAALTADWVILEMLGYDQPDAGVIAAQGLSFLGTPTTLLLKPRTGDRRLGDARQVAAIVGYPDDYAARLEGAIAGHDAIAAAQAQLRERNDVESLEALARAFLAAGDAAAARRVYQSLLLREELTAEQRQDTALQAILQPTQRVEKDHRRTLQELVAWADAFPAGRDDPDYHYARAWSLLSLGEHEAAMAVIREVYLDSEDPDRVASYLYLAFRSPSDVLLVEAEARARAAVSRFPEQAARFYAAHGRLLRRLGRLQEAEEAFGRAVAGVPVDHPNHGTYLGQLAFVRKELAGATN